jgi:hypothetical protein
MNVGFGGRGASTPYYTGLSCIFLAHPTVSHISEEACFPSLGKSRVQIWVPGVSLLLGSPGIQASS